VFLPRSYRLDLRESDIQKNRRRVFWIVLSAQRCALLAKGVGGMGFCTKCGRERTGGARFCGGCGAAFSDADEAAPQVVGVTSQPAAPAEAAGAPAPVAATTAAPEPADTPEAPAPVAQTTVEPAVPAAPAATDLAPPVEPSNADLTRWDTHWYRQDPAPQPPGPFAATPPPAPPTETALPPAPPSYGPPSYGQGYGPGPSGQPSYGPASYGQASYGQAPPGQPPYQPPPHVPGSAGSHPLRRSQSAILITLLVVVLLAVGGGAYALVSHFTGRKTVAQPPSHPTVSAAAKATSSAAASTPASTPTATASTSPTGSATPSGTASPSTSPTAAVIVSPAAAANPAEPGIAALVNEYFTAINAHDYTAYNNLLAPQQQAADTRSSFDTGYGSTTDSNEKLTGITDTSNGGEAATLSFTSHQNAADSATQSTCTSWKITLYLEPNGNSYLIGPTPPGYHAQYAAC
jgi:hypothetical protein